MDQRTCSKCGRTKAIDQFHRDARSPGGFRRQCKECRCAQTLEWWYANQERQLARHREYVDANRDRVRAIDMERYERNRDARIDLVMGNTHARRAKVRGSDYDTSVTPSVLRERDGDACHYCGVEMDFSRARGKWQGNKATVDHVVPISAGGSHTFDNVVLACWTCNAGKGARDADAFRERRQRGQARDSA